MEQTGPFSMHIFTFRQRFLCVSTAQTRGTRSGHGGKRLPQKTHNTILDSSLNEILLILLLQEVHHPSHLFATFNRP